MEYRKKIRILNRIKLCPRSWDNRFVCDLQGKEEENLTEKQREWIDNLFYKYRRQIIQTRFKNLVETSKEIFLNLFREGHEYLINGKLL